MERAVDEVMKRVRIVYEMVTGQPAPEFSANNPYARIPPEVDREEHVLRQAAALFERVRNFGSDVASRPVQTFGGETAPSPIGMYRDGSDLRFVFDVGSTSRERITVELQATAVRVSSETQGEAKDSAERARVTQTAYLPARVDPSAVTAELTDGFLTVRVRMPLFDDAIHKIEIR